MSAHAQTRSPNADAREVEDIYVARSLRESRVDPTQYCSEDRAGFTGTAFEDRYTFHSVVTRAHDGLVTNPAENEIGRLHACVAPTLDPLVVNFFGEGGIADVSFRVIGDCRAPALDHPEPGVTFYSCSFTISDLPEPYFAGHLTTSTISSRAALGAVSDPVGYVQPSIATIRLWKRPR
jgi:hypothetical protein